jgi:cob(I)alamin adenosyltransferase
VDDGTFNEPRLALNRIYTKRGDQGETNLAGGQRVSKSDPRIDCYGTVDELNSFVGLARTSVEELLSSHSQLAELDTILHRVQHELFNLGSILATIPEDVGPRQPRITDTEVGRLEQEIDQFNAELPVLQSFVLPGGSRLNAELHVCRTVCRRAERLLVALARRESVPEPAIRYLNRLSDALFVWSRWVSRTTGSTEILWQPNQSASGLEP